MGLLEHSPDPEIVISTRSLNALTAVDPKPGSEYMCLKSYMDSGAARSVCPVDFGSQFGISETNASKRGEIFQWLPPNGFVIKGAFDRWRN